MPTPDHPKMQKVRFNQSLSKEDRAVYGEHDAGAVAEYDAKTAAEIKRKKLADYIGPKTDEPTRGAPVNTTVGPRP